MATALTIAVNHSTEDSPYNTSGVDWIDVNLDNDTLIFSAGSDVVKDGESIPGDSALNQAGSRINEGVAVIIDKYFLADVDVNLLKEVYNMGNQNKRYVLGFSFDDETTSEPVLEVWDDSTMLTVASVALGAGTPSNSWYKGVVTTDALPGADWAGSALAGASDGHFLQLNNGNGALSVADVLYCNLKIIVPVTVTDSGAFTPVIVCKYTTI